jgi:valyl-tRNA synthetase
VLDRETKEDLGDWSEMEKSLGNIQGEEKVFDTWMDSSNSNLFVSGYLSDNDTFERAFPTGIRPQGKEIVRTWLYYTLLKSTLLFDKPGFKNVWIDGLGMDPWGRKMSKSLGNGIDANSVLECGAGGRTGSWKVKGPNKTVNLKANKIGSECFRLWKACDAQVGDDFQINPEEIEAKYYGVLTKLFNVARFASQFDIPDDLDTPPSELSISERWILSEFAAVNLTVRDAWGNIDIYTAAQTIKNFGTGVFPSHWLEMAKTRLYNDDAGAAWTIHRIVRDLLTMFSPICPFLCHHLSSTLYGESAVDVRNFPSLPISELGEGDLGDELRQLTSIITEFNSDVWAAKNEAGLGRGKPISGIEIPAELEAFTSHLITMHKLE